MKIALFGASGFVGSNLAHHLERSEQHSVRLCDVEDKKLRLRFENRSFDYETVDISSDKDRVDQIVSDSDLVFDLAAFVHPAMFISNPLDVVQLNLFDCLGVIRSCVKHKKRLIHFSTSEVYGKTGGSTEPFQEDQTDLVLGPIRNQRWIYSCAKQLLDRMVFAYGVEHGLNYTLVRPFNFVGPLMDKFSKAWDRNDNPRVFANFMSSLVYDRPMMLVDGGASRRCFTYIDDAVSALQTIMDHPDETNRQIINIGNPANEITIRGLAEKMAALYVKEFDAQAQPKIESVRSTDFYGHGYEDCDRRMPDISKLSALGWKPQYGLDETLMKSMSYFVSNKTRMVEMLGD
ncbi:MAG: bifunctional UDP-4-keto-pentose/UDP-xylose synthase [Pseudomonadota bacterium]